MPHPIHEASALKMHNEKLCRVMSTVPSADTKQNSSHPDHLPRRCGARLGRHSAQTRNVEGILYGKASTIQTSSRGWVSSSRPSLTKTHIFNASLSSPSHIIPVGRNPYRPPNQTRSHDTPPNGDIPTPPPPRNHQHDKLLLQEAVRRGVVLADRWAVHMFSLACIIFRRALQAFGKDC